MSSGGDHDRAAAIGRGCQRVCVLTGAGISTDSGIPDFRGPNGIWTRDPGAQRYVDLDAYRHDASVRIESWRRRVTHPAFSAAPNAAHRCLVELYRRGRLLAVLTQNVDGLHQLAGLPADVVVELHGTVHQTECLGCGWRGPMADAVARVRAGEADPHCQRCGSILKSATVFFGQALAQEAIAAALAAVFGCDLLIAVGTSLTVAPVANLVGGAARAGVPVVIVNASPTRYDGQAIAVIREPIATALPALVEAIIGDSDTPGGPGRAGRSESETLA